MPRTARAFVYFISLRAQRVRALGGCEPKEGCGLQDSADGDGAEVAGGVGVDVAVGGAVDEVGRVDAEHQVGEVSLIEGSVGVRNSRISDMVVLMPGQKAEIDQKTGMLRVSEVNTRLAAIWHDDLIPFENASIVEIARTLEQVYGVKVVLASGLDLQSTYSGSIQRKKDIDSVLRALCNTVPVRYRITNQTITLSGQ